METHIFEAIHGELIQNFYEGKNIPDRVGVQTKKNINYPGLSYSYAYDTNIWVPSQLAFRGGVEHTASK